MTVSSCLGRRLWSSHEPSRPHVSKRQNTTNNKRFILANKTKTSQNNNSRAQSNWLCKRYKREQSKRKEDYRRSELYATLRHTQHHSALQYASAYYATKTKPQVPKCPEPKVSGQNALRVHRSDSGAAFTCAGVAGVTFLRDCGRTLR